MRADFVPLLHEAPRINGRLSQKALINNVFSPNDRACAPGCGGVRGSLTMIKVMRACRMAFLLLFLSAAAGHAQPAAVSTYRMNAGDVLEVFVWGEERLQREVRVLPDGTISFPLVGTVRAEGRTAEEVGAEIRTRVAPQFRAGPPEVTVSVKDTPGMRFYVIGKVRAPGSFTIGQNVNALQALSLAGGPTEFADVENAVIMREGANGQTVERVRIAEALKGAKRAIGGAPQRILPILQSGDVLVIP
jgi:polysaccharide biosynthesis/export protein